MKVRKFLVVLILLFSSLFFSCDSILDMLGLSSNGSTLFTNTEAVEAMKSALNIGAESSSDQLSKEDAYYKTALKIFLPDEVYSALDAVDDLKDNPYLEDIPLVGELVTELSSGLVEKVVLSVNRSAEQAAKEVVPIFSKAITDMTVQDGIKIVTGEDDAATEYLKENTYSQLMELYQPKMNAVLSQSLVGDMSANTAWKNLTDKFNKVVDSGAAKLAKSVGYDIPEPININLSEYVTGKALDGLFVKVAEEEGKIRENPFDYASNIVQKVFGAVKNGLGS